MWKARNILLKQLTFGHQHHQLQVLYLQGARTNKKKKGKKVLGLENFPSIIEVLNPNDLFDEKSKIFPKLFSHKSSIFNSIWG